MDPNTLAQHTVVAKAVAAATSDAAPSRVVAGYTLEQRLGTGGYGEVWRAVGPGGLPKAVKILHGHYDGPQAETELRSLERVKTLRHPFLLSIERIEVVEGRLIVVTELADGCLRQRYDQARKDGARGIAREALLRYLKDAAEALDYLCEHHGLQHLDIKPDNLLFQGGHVKVADFGLAKEIGLSNESRICGLTPLYSPPELFEGRPSPGSDQYSLAIVYQEMLTGVPPFAGRTAAQLVAQHLSSQPNLSALAPSDRPAVARALSKNPNGRFQTCREFVAQLSARKSTTHRSNRARMVRHHKRFRPVQRDAVDSAVTPDAASERHSSIRPEATPGPQPEAASARGTYSPSLVVGLGGLAGRVLCQLRQRMRTAFLHASELPSVPVLLIDTDESAIAAARSDGNASHLTMNETLAIPLRSTSDYRQDRSRYLEWLSRRWLYNIPRSRQVSGIRPLGRLAFVDHHHSIRDRLRATIAAAIDSTATGATRAITGLPFESDGLTVYVVAATSGGTGSGCALDLSYLLQDVILEMGISQHAIVGLLLHAASAGSSRHQVETANTLSFLQELKYYSTPALAYPGDATCSLPAFDQRPFDDTYLVPLGDPSNEERLQQDVRFFAEYLFRNALTPARGFFQGCRRRERCATTAGGERIGLRSFRIAETVEHVREDIEKEALHVCLAAVRQWRDDRRQPTEIRHADRSSVSEWTQSLLSQAGLQTEQLAAFATKTIADEGRRWIESYARVLSEESLQHRFSIAALLHHIDRDFEVDETGQTSSRSPGQAVAKVRKTLISMCEQSSQMIRDGILSLLDDARHRLTGSCEARHLVASELERIEQRVSSLAEQVQRDIALMTEEGESAGGREAVHRSSSALRNPPHAAVDFSCCHRYCMLKFCESVYRAILESVTEIRERTGELRDTLRGALDSLKEVERYLTAATDAPSESSADHHGSLRWSRAKALAERFDDHLRATPTTPLSQLAGGTMSVQEWFQSLRREAFDFLLEDAGATGFALLSTEVELLSKPSSEVAHGTGCQILAMFPKVNCLADLPQRLARGSSACTTWNKDVRGDLFLCCEQEGLDLNTYRTGLASSHPDAVDLASRVHSRIDIEWE
ncbi:MAG: serine/threonine protein kinase [Pirellulaceae bacterium]